MATDGKNRQERHKAVMRHDAQGRPVYRSGLAPEGLDTAAQLRARRLSPAGLVPVAWLYYSVLHHRLCPLYDRAWARPIRPLTDRQRHVLAEGRKLANTVPCGRCGQARVSVWEREALCGTCRPVVEAERYEAWVWRQRRQADEHERMLVTDRTAAAAWAAAVLADPAVVVLDTETTGLDGAFLVEVAVVAGDGTVLLDTLVDPQVPIPVEATSIHGITDAMVADKPTFGEILPELTRVLAGHRVVIYNQTFDRGVLSTELDRHHRAVEPDAAPEPWCTHPSTQIWMSALRTECAMIEYARWVGDWHDYWESYTWQPLSGGHRARGDCEAVLDRLSRMAGTAGGAITSREQQAC